MTKTCIITGGSSGIGLSIAKAFVKEGYQVFNLDIQASEYGHFIKCDVTDVAAVKDAINTVGRQHGIDALVSNAGIHFSANIEDTSEADLTRVFNINVKGAYAATQACLPFMRQQQNGAIIYIASDQAIIGKRNSFAYNLSKSALASMARTTALDYAQYNIRANAVCPGTIETPLYHNAINRYVEQSGADIDQVHQEEAALQPLGRLGQPEEVAELTLFLASDKAKFITGSLQVIDGGYTAK